TAPSNCVINVYREVMFKVAGAKPSVFINDKDYGLLIAGGYVRVELPPGELAIEVSDRNQKGMVVWASEPYFYSTEISSSEEKYCKFVIDYSDVNMFVIPMGTGAAVVHKGKAKIFIQEEKKNSAETELKNYRKIIKR